MPHGCLARHDGFNRAYFNRAYFEGDVSFWGANFSEGSDITFGNPATVFVSGVSQDINNKNIINSNKSIIDLDDSFISGIHRGSSFSGTSFYINISSIAGADFGEAKFCGIADFFGTNFRGNANFAGSVFYYWARFGRSNFFDYADFKDSRFKGPLSYYGAFFSVQPGTDFGGATFSKDVNFYNTTFNNVRFLSTKFGGSANFDAATLGRYVNFESANFNTTVSFNGATFLKDSGFYKHTFKDANFSENASFQDAIFNEYVDFGSTFFRKSASFIRSNFKKDTVFDKAIFSDYADFSETNFNENVDFKEATFGNNVDFSGANFTLNADFKGAIFYDQADFSEANFTSNADFSEANLNKNIDINSTFFIGHLLGWKYIKNYINCDEVTYLRLIKNFKDHGQFDDADQCYYQYRFQYMSGLVDRIGWISCGFGVRLDHVIGWSIFVVLVFALIYWKTKCIYKLNNPKIILKKHKYILSRGDAIFFSALVFFTLHPPHDWEYSQNWRYLVLFEDILGGALISLFIVVLGNIIIR